MPPALPGQGFGAETWGPPGEGCPPSAGDLEEGPQAAPRGGVPQPCWCLDTYLLLWTQTWTLTLGPAWSLWPSLDCSRRCYHHRTLPGLASAPATGTLCWSPLPFLGLPCVSLRYGGTGLWLLRRCPALPHGTVLSVAAPRSSRPLQWGAPERPGLLPVPGPALGGGRERLRHRSVNRRWTGSTACGLGSW